jgi:hypothetical protein
LSQPLATFRPLLLALDATGAVQAALSTGGRASILPPALIVPPLGTGFQRVVVSANLPDQRLDLLSAGVTLRAPPALPARPQAAVASAELTPPDDAAVLLLRLAPGEPLRYVYSTFVVLAEAGSLRRLESPESAGEGERLALTPDDFPVRFVVLEASPDLLELAAIECRCRWAGHEVACALRADLATVAVPIPREAGDAVLELEARPLQAGRALRIGPLPAAHLSLGLPTFPEYGPHSVPVECRFGNSTPLVAVELVAEERAQDPQAVDVLALTPAQPSKEWRYFASSPFRSGYHYRLRGAPGAPAVQWSQVRSAFEPLVLEAT